MPTYNFTLSVETDDNDERSEPDQWANIATSALLDAGALGARIEVAADNPGSVNLPTEDPQKWARAQFEFENCEECGGDETNHDIVPVLGNWFARCRTVGESATGSVKPEMMEDKGETSTEWYKRVSDEPATGSVKSDEVDRAAAMTLVNDANARGVLAREIWSGNAPADLMVRFRSLSNNAAEYVAYLGYSNGDNDWRAAAGLPAATDDTPEPSADAVKLDPDPGLNALLTEMRDTPEPDDDKTVTAFNRLRSVPDNAADKADFVKSRLTRDLAEAVAQRAAGAHPSTYLLGRLNEPGISWDDDWNLRAWDYDPTDPRKHIVVTEADIAPVKVCPECTGPLTPPSPKGEAGDDSFYCPGCGANWSLDLSKRLL